jgi:hypothetical protein
MPSQFASTLASLGFELPEWCLPPSEPLVRGYEAQFALTLPADYREFLVHHGGVIGSASCAFQEHLYRLGTTFGEFIERLEKVA